MNDTISTDPRPDVADFVAGVRARLADLTEEEREELVGGLDGDLAELVADGGSVAELGDPRAYADELRAAAGLDQRRWTPAAVLRRPSGRSLGELVDDTRARWDRLVGRPGSAPVWAFLVALRPVWWIARAWLAVQLLDLLTGPEEPPTPVPTLDGPRLGALVTLVAVVVSVQIGRGHWWPGATARRGPAARVLLLALNSFAVAVVPVVLGGFPPSGSADPRAFTASARPSGGLMNRGHYVQNVFPYDAQGRPLTGVQLFDQDGRPLSVNRGEASDWSAQTGRVAVVYPWLSGGDRRRAYNVFPLPRRSQPGYDDGVHAGAWTSAAPPRLPQPPLVAVPPATLPSPTPPR